MPRGTIIVALVITTLVMSAPRERGYAATRPATQEDLEWMRAAGIPKPEPGTMIDPADPSVGQEIGEIKLWLAKHATKNVIVSCFEPGFAKKLKTFMEAVPGGPPIITDGYRDPSKQPALVASGASKAGPCQSYHNYGLAADFNGKANIPWMRSNSRAFGINTIGAWDPGHFQENRGRFGQCGACSGGYTGSQQSPGTSSFAPMNLGDRFRNLLGGQPAAQPQSAPRPQPAPPMQPVPQQPGTTQPGQYFTPVREEPLVPKPATSSPGETTAPAQKPSASDILLEIAYGTPISATSSNTATSVPIYIDGSDVGTISHDSRDGTQPASTTAVISPVTLRPADTFGGEGFRTDYQVVSSSYEESGPMRAVLLSMRDALSSLLSILRPMGVRSAIMGEPHPADEEMFLE